MMNKKQQPKNNFRENQLIYFDYHAYKSTKLHKFVLPKKKGKENHKHVYLICTKEQLTEFI